MTSVSFSRTVTRLNRALKRHWIDRLDACETYRGPEGRAIRLPNGRIWAVSEDHFVSVVADTLSGPNPDDLRVEILRRLCTPAEWKEAEAMAGGFRQALAALRAASAAEDEARAAHAALAGETAPAKRERPRIILPPGVGS